MNSVARDMLPDDASDASFEVVGESHIRKCLLAEDRGGDDDDDDDMELLRALDVGGSEAETEVGGGPSIPSPTLKRRNAEQAQEEEESAIEEGLQHSKKLKTDFTSLDEVIIPPLDVQETPSTELIDLEAIVEVSDDEEEEYPQPSLEIKPVKDYRCPICFDPPDTAVITPCGHIFCNSCLFRMVNTSRTNRKDGHCALCRRSVKFRDIRMVILRKKRIRKQKASFK